MATSLARFSHMLRWPLRRNPRRIVVTALVLCALAPHALVVAQVTSTPRVGVLWFGDAPASAPYHKAFVDGLEELGYVEGKNLLLITRYAEGNEARIPALLEELIGLRVDVLLITGKAVDAAKKATSSIPIVCATMADPVATHQVVSLARPGGNLTGVSWQTVDTATKRLELARELVPKLTSLGVLFDAGDPGARLEVDLIRHAARLGGIRLLSFEMRSAGDVPSAFTSIAKERPDALLIVDSAITAGARKQIGELALKGRVPMISEGRVFAEAGGVLTYGAKLTPALKRGAVYVGKILKGAKPSELPIEQPTEFELVVNLNAAKIVGVKIPSSILDHADQVIR